jgi:hypothetical protein
MRNGNLIRTRLITDVTTQQPVAQIKLSAGTLFSSCFRSVRLHPAYGGIYPLNDPSSLKSQTRLAVAGLRHATCPLGILILQPGTHGGTTWVATKPYSMSPSEKVLPAVVFMKK